MKSFLKQIITTTTFRQSSITFAGTIINGFLGILFYIVVARILGPVELGLFTLATVTLTLISDMVDIGTNTGLVRFVSLNLDHDKDQAIRFLKLSLEIKLVVWLFSFLVVFFLSPFIANQFFHQPGLINPLRLVAIGIGGALLFSYATSALQAYQKYFLWSAVNIISNFLRLISILLLGYYLVVNSSSSLIVYIIFPFFGFFISLLILPTRQIFSVKGELKLTRKLFSYNIPVAIFTIISAFSARLDTYMTASILNIKEVGIYGVATQLNQVMPQLVSAIGLVSAPKFASFQNNQQMLTYLKKLQGLVTFLCLLGILAIPIASYFIPIIYGAEYQTAIMPFIFIFLAMLVFLFSVPVHNSVIFYFGRPDVFIWTSIGYLLIIGGLGYLLISSLGIMGAAITVLVGNSFNFIYPLIWLLLRLRKDK